MLTSLFIFLGCLLGGILLITLLRHLCRKPQSTPSPSSEQSSPSSPQTSGSDASPQSTPSGKFVSAHSSHSLDLTKSELWEILRAHYPHLGPVPERLSIQADCMGMSIASQGYDLTLYWTRGIEDQVL